MGLSQDFTKERENSMKRFVAVLLALALMFSLAGCASAEEKEAAKAVSTQIAELTGVTLEDAAAVADALEKYYALTEQARKLVENYDILETACADLAKIVTGKIAEIGTVTLDSAPIINSALDAYSALPEEAKTLVENYAALEAAIETHREIFLEELNRETEIIQEINAARNDLDITKVLSMIEDQLPISEKLAKSQYYQSEEDAVTFMTNLRDMLVAACYPNTSIISLDNFIEIEEVLPGTADSNEGEKPDVDEDTGMDFYTYDFVTPKMMDDAFLAYTEYLDIYFELVEKISEPVQYQYSALIDSMIATASAEYFYKDSQGYVFSVEWNYLNSESIFGDLPRIYVRFSTEMGVGASFGG